MKIVIDIPEELLKQDVYTNVDLIQTIAPAVHSGIVLPKGHGRLGDLDALIERLLPKYYDWFGEGEQDDFSRGNNSMLEEVVEAIKEFPTIIEADTERSNNVKDSD